jgi:hypothetical protein
MSTKHTIKTFVFGAFAFILLSAFILKGKDPLGKRIYDINITEVKEGAPAKKATPDELEFKDGKMFSNFLEEKFGFKWIRYEMKKDSSFIDETETEIHRYEIEASSTDETDQTMIFTCVIDNYDITGEIKITKKDKLKKKFEFDGKERYSKPKKDKK